MYTEQAIKVIPVVISNFKDELEALEQFLMDFPDHPGRWLKADDYEILFKLIVSKMGRLEFIYERFWNLRKSFPEEWRSNKELVVMHEWVDTYIVAIKSLLGSYGYYRSGYYKYWQTLLEKKMK